MLLHDIFFLSWFNLIGNVHATPFFINWCNEIYYCVSQYQTQYSEVC
jgi:hypothetical protein